MSKRLDRQITDFAGVADGSMLELVRSTLCIVRGMLPTHYVRYATHQSMSEYEQRTIEQFFQDHGIEDPDAKARLLQKLTHIIYGYNQSVIKYQEEQDEYRKSQFEREIQEIRDKIDRVIQEEQSGKNPEYAP
ncbi:hypothetical protein GF380_04390 [Candidatus Uhrbacteria bacterium]|nr:hypothetical protein [Candidatus Uhrbacteria bacterium]MBD3284299.1 hypothetical protein [Candidatus Uhrbacteria bacterium]